MVLILILEVLVKQLGCPVMPIQAHKKIGICELKQAMSKNLVLGDGLLLDLPIAVKESLAHLRAND